MMMRKTDFCYGAIRLGDSKKHKAQSVFAVTQAWAVEAPSWWWGWKFKVQWLVTATFFIVETDITPPPSQGKAPEDRGHSAST